MSYYEIRSLRQCCNYVSYKGDHVFPRDICDRCGQLNPPVVKVKVRTTFPMFRPKQFEVLEILESEDG